MKLILDSKLKQIIKSLPWNDNIYCKIFEGGLYIQSEKLENTFIQQLIIADTSFEYFDFEETGEFALEFEEKDLFYKLINSTENVTIHFKVDDENVHVISNNIKLTFINDDVKIFNVLKLKLSNSISLDSTNFKKLMNNFNKKFVDLEDCIVLTLDSKQFKLKNDDTKDFIEIKFRKLMQSVFHWKAKKNNYISIDKDYFMSIIKNIHQLPVLKIELENYKPVRFTQVFNGNKLISIITPRFSEEERKKIKKLQEALKKK